MLKETIVAMLVVAAGAVAGARERDLIARFDGGIGVIPVTGGTGTPNGDGSLPNVKLNVVRGVSPAGPWRIADLRAVIESDGEFTVDGKGLLLASGNGIGTNAGATVFATLFCDTTQPFDPHNTTSVPLDANGNFHIEGTLDSIPAGCAKPALLIRNSGNGVWFAAGIPKLGDD